MIQAPADGSGFVANARIGTSPDCGNPIDKKRAAPNVRLSPSLGKLPARRGQGLFVRPTIGTARVRGQWSRPGHGTGVLERRSSCRRLELEGRSPRLLLRLPGSLLLRFAARAFLASLFQEPPRFTRLEPVSPPNHLLRCKTPICEARRCPRAPRGPPGSPSTSRTLPR